MWYLVASFVITNILHGWLLFGHQGKHLATISHHTVTSNRSLRIYTVTHLVLGVLLWLFISELFNSPVVLVVAGVAVLCEWLQALLPARGKTEPAHTLFAVAMASSMTLLVLLCTLLFAPNLIVMTFNIVATTVVASFFLVMKYPPKAGTWKFQFAGQIVLYLQVFLLLY